MKPTPKPRSNPNPLAPWKEIRGMPLNLNRFLDATASITIVFLALYLGAATVGLGV
jgi:hypothetical protein